MTSDAPILGSITPRIATRPRGELTPATSDGFAVAEFARDTLCSPLFEWQEWLWIHALEKLPDGRPRFRRVLILVSRQAGKTTAVSRLAAWKLWCDPNCALVWGLSAVESTAREAWDATLALAEDAGLPFGVTRQGRPDIVTTNGRVGFSTADGSRYRISAANRRGGRGYSIDLVLADELREQRNRDSYDATYPAMNARPFAQWLGISNGGYDDSVVLNSLREEALAVVDDPDADIGIFEWSAEDGLAPDDPLAWVQAQPQLGRTVPVKAYATEAKAALAEGGERLARFETEYLCRRVRVMNPAIDASLWTRCLDEGDLSAFRSRVVLCVDVSPDHLHATAVAAAVQGDGRCRVEVVDAWDGLGAPERLRRALPTLVAKVKPRVLGWFPDGPAASLLAEMKPRPGWPPAGVQVQPIRGETGAVCMQFAQEVTAGTVAHSGDPLLSAHVEAAERLPRPGGQWVFSRKGGQCDAAYAAAGAVYLARTLPPPPKVDKFVFVD